GRGHVVAQASKPEPLFGRRVVRHAGLDLWGEGPILPSLPAQWKGLKTPGVLPTWLVSYHRLNRGAIRGATRFSVVWKRKNPDLTRCQVGASAAGDLGFEPRLTDPESVVLPLHQSPLGLCPVAG